MQQEQESPQLCLAGCGFFGHQASGGMCSLCYKKNLSKRQLETDATKVETPAKAEEQQQVPDAKNHSEEAVATVVVAAAAEEQEDDAAAKPVQTNKKRCWECKKKVGLTAIECRCGFVFCNNHRYADQHSCSFDFKASDRAELARRNPGGGQFGKLEKL